MSHLLIALILAEVFNIKKKSIVVLGALTPDLIAKIHLIYFYLGIKPIVLFSSFHTPIMPFLISLLIAPLFMYNPIRFIIRFIISFNIDSMSEILSDLTIKHFAASGQRLLFPFSMKNYSLNLMWPEKSFYILAVSLAIYLMVILLKKRCNMHFFYIFIKQD